MPPRAVLLVEDEPDIALVVRLCLDPGRFAIACAGTLAEARDLLARRPVPDLVILDLSLPDGDGLALCQEVKGAHPTLPVLVLTALAEGAERQRAEAAGADRFLAKPFEPDELLHEVERLLGAAP